MERVLFFLVHYGVPAVILMVAVKHTPKSRLGSWASLELFGAVLLFLYLWGQWPLVGSNYARFLPIVMLIPVLMRFLVSLRDKPPLFNPKIVPNLGSIAMLAVGGLAAFGVWGALAGRSYSAPYADLTFPLASGTFYVGSGGSKPVINNHIRSTPTSQQFALDINQLGSLGGASSNILSTANANHHIFGHEVLAPCDGTVTEAVNDVADNAGSSMDVSSEDGSGNHVAIDCDGVIVTMVHLKEGSVAVEVGDATTVGMRLGEVGNSGFSQEPHLHLQAAVPGEDGGFVGIPMRFGDKAYVRGDVISN